MINNFQAYEITNAFNSMTYRKIYRNAEYESCFYPSVVYARAIDIDSFQSVVFYSFLQFFVDFVRSERLNSILRRFI